MDVIEMLKNLFYSEDHQARWNEDPEKYLKDEGAEGLSVQQVNEAAQLAFSTTDLGAEVNVGGNQTVGDTEFCQDADQDGVSPEVAAAVAEGLDKNLPRTGGTSEAAPAPQPVSPPPPPAPAPHLTTNQQIEETINYYITNVTETNVDDRDTYVDNSVGDIVNVGGTVDIDQDTTVASGDGAVATGDNNSGPINTGDGGVAVDTDGGDAGPIGTGSGPVVDASAEAGEGGDAEGGTVIIGDGNENNDVDVDFGEGGGGGGDINIGVGSGDTNQDNHTEDNDGYDNDGIDDRDGVDYDDNDWVDDKDGVDYDDNDLLDVDADFGRGGVLRPERELVVEEVAEVGPAKAVEPAVVEEPKLPEAHVMPAEEVLVEQPMVAEPEHVEPAVEEPMDMELVGE